ncbi:hypothetical protein M3617_28305, partial [Peribacillus frigoritolerans]|nr:hypothetical protein [Peribacillus frigoritolerans]
LIHHRTSEQNRIHKILQDANIKLTSVLSDIFGLSGRRILEAILNGEKIETDGLRKRITKRQGKMKGRIASAHLLVTITYNILKTGEPYHELGSNY